MILPLFTCKMVLLLSIFCWISLQSSNYFFSCWTWWCFPRCLFRRNGDHLEKSTIHAVGTTSFNSSSSAQHAFHNWDINSECLGQALERVHRSKHSRISGVNGRGKCPMGKDWRDEKATCDSGVFLPLYSVTLSWTRIELCLYLRCPDDRDKSDGILQRVHVRT